jgi:HEAT repeat protein
MSALTPTQLFNGFRISTSSWEKQLRLNLQAIEDFSKVSDKKAFLRPTIQFLKEEKEDTVRSWGTSVLALIGGEQVSDYLVDLLDSKKVQHTESDYLYTRFFALVGLHKMAENLRPSAVEKIEELCGQIWQNENEDHLVRSLAAAWLAAKKQVAPSQYLAKELSKNEYSQVVPTLRALTEIAVGELAGAVIELMKKGDYEKWEFRWHAIRAAGNLKNHSDVLYKLGRIVRDEPTNYLRLEAVKSLGRLGDPAARDYLLYALEDDDAEVRWQAAISLTKVFPIEKAVIAIVQTALDPGKDPSLHTHLVEGLRRVDPTRTTTTEILSNELTAEDRVRAETAEKLLIDLGGWAAMQRLSQRRLTLNRLDGLLSDSEKAAHDMFQSTIRQARFNFYFAMAVNMVIVLTGIVLVGLAIRQLFVNPENLASWILPGATGVFGVLINLVFNNPRRNASDDLNTLMVVTVKFFGFLRKLNEIDATFKYLYLEATDFNIDRLRETIDEIQDAVAETLQSADEPSQTTGTDKATAQPPTPRVSEQNFQLDPTPN